MKNEKEKLSKTIIPTEKLNKNKANCTKSGVIEMGWKKAPAARNCGNIGFLVDKRKNIRYNEFTAEKPVENPGFAS